MLNTEISDRVNLMHIQRLNGLMLKIFAAAFTLSVLQDFVLYFGFKQIKFSLLLTNMFFLLIITAPSYFLYKRKSNPKLVGIYNVFVCISYITFTLISYDLSPSFIMFIAFNIIVASIYLDFKGYILVSFFSLIEVVYFSYYPAYMPQGPFWLEVVNRLQVMLFVSLFCYGVLRPSQILLSELLERELQAMQMAHELRNPLTTVKGFLQLMDNRTTRKDDSFELLIEELDRANSILTDYLTLYKPSAKNIHNYDINKIIASVVELFGMQAYGQKIIIEKKLDSRLPQLSVDMNQIKQVIINLIKNAIQAIGHEGNISIYSHYDRDKRSIIITIKDNGPGFPAEMLKNELTPFFTTKKDGNGLGLPVCKKIILNHGGNIEFGNNPDKGSYVSISLPINMSNKAA